MTQTMTVPTTDGIRDFTDEKPPIKFKIKKSPNSDQYDVFEGLSDLPATLLVEFAGLSEKITESSLTDQPKIFNALFELILTEESSQRFIERMSSKTEPIGINQINEILSWVMDQYGFGRPMEPSLDSSTGSESQDGGKSSMENAPLPESTSDASLVNASST